MDAVEKFFESDAFFPFLIILLVLLILTLLWVTLSNRKRKNVINVPQNSVVDDESIVKVIDNSVLPSVPVVETKEIENAIEEVNEIKVDNSEVLSTVDIPIPKVDDTPVELEFPEIKETNELELMLDNTSNKIEETDNIAQSIIDEISVSSVEEIELPKMNEEVISENEISSLIEQTPNIDNAFGGIPSEDTSINESIVVEEPKEYVGEKTEVFDLPSLKSSSIDNNTAESLANIQSIENDIIEAANQYVASVMSR